MRRGWSAVALTPLVVLFVVAVSSPTTADAEPFLAGRQQADALGASALVRPLSASSTRMPESSAGQQIVVVTVPSVIFEESVVASRGWLRTQVLLTRPGASAMVTLESGSTSYCPTALEVGRVTTFKCPISVPTQRLDLVVRTDDGHRYTHDVSGR